MRSILLHVDDDDCFEARFQVALDLARAFDGHLTCVQAIPVDFAVAGDAYGAMVAELLPVLRENADKLRQRVELRLADEALPWDWVQDLDGAGRLLLAHAALSELVVLGAREPHRGKGASGLVGQMVIHGPSPALVVPPATRSFDVTAPAVVAWNGSAQAAHALRAAVPLLRRAGAVHLIAIAEPRDKRDYDLPSTAGAEFLSRHDIACEIVEMPPLAGSVEGALREAAEARGAGCIVMGAYGHSRLQEVVLGGLTRGLLGNPPVPLFLCH